MDPPELWPALDIIENLDTLPIKLKEPPNFRRRVAVFVILRYARESERTSREPRAVNTSKVERTSHNGSVASAMARHGFKCTREH